MISDIGGTLGFCMGASVLALIQLPYLIGKGVIERKNNDKDDKYDIQIDPIINSTKMYSVLSS